MKILLLIDGSMWSHKAAIHATVIAKKKKAEVVVFSVLDREEAKAVAFNFCMESGMCDRIANYEEQIWRDMKKHLQEEVHAITSHFIRQDIACTSRIVEGSPEEEIINEARDGGYSLVVMGGHGKRGRTQMGGLFEEIGGHIGIPLLVVK